MAMAWPQCRQTKVGNAVLDGMAAACPLLVRWVMRRLAQLAHAAAHAKKPITRRSISRIRARLKPCESFSKRTARPCKRCVLQGSFNHHAIPGNVRRLDIFRKEACRARLHALLDAGECRMRSTAVPWPPPLASSQSRLSTRPCANPSAILRLVPAPTSAVA